jgi:hypothetical protein
MLQVLSSYKDISCLYRWDFPLLSKRTFGLIVSSLQKNFKPVRKLQKYDNIYMRTPSYPTREVSFAALLSAVMLPYSTFLL